MPKENLKTKNSGLRLGSHAKPVEASGVGNYCGS